MDSLPLLTTALRCVARQRKVLSLEALGVLSALIWEPMKPQKAPVMQQKGPVEDPFNGTNLRNSIHKTGEVGNERS